MFTFKKIERYDYFLTQLSKNMLKRIPRTDTVVLNNIVDMTVKMPKNQSEAYANVHIKNEYVDITLNSFFIPSIEVLDKLKFFNVLSTPCIKSSLPKDIQKDLELCMRFEDEVHMEMIEKVIANVDAERQALNENIEKEIENLERYISLLREKQNQIVQIFGTENDNLVIIYTNQIESKIELLTKRINQFIEIANSN